MLLAALFAALGPKAFGLALLVFLSAAAGDLVQIFGIRRIAAARPDPHSVARFSVLEWSIGAIGWLIVVKTQDFGYLIPEVLGLYLGSWYACRHAACIPARAVPS
jgi:hypothetical protein